MKRAVCFLLCLTLTGLGCSSLGGKVETTFTETVTDPDGFTTTTGYEAVSKAGMDYWDWAPRFDLLCLLATSTQAYWAVIAGTALALLYAIVAILTAPYQTSNPKQSRIPAFCHVAGG